MLRKHFHDLKPLVVLKQMLFNEILSFVVLDIHVNIHSANFLLLEFHLAVFKSKLSFS